jgi:hypothetical protein
MGGFTWGGRAWLLPDLRAFRSQQHPRISRDGRHHMAHPAGLGVAGARRGMHPQRRQRHPRDRVDIPIHLTVDGLGVLPALPPYRQEDRDPHTRLAERTLLAAPEGQRESLADWMLFTMQTRDRKLNPVALDNPNNELLTHRLHSSAPQLIPQRFEISPLPDGVLLFVEHVLQTTESSMTRRSQRRTKTGTGLGGGGLDSANKPESWTRSCLTFPSRKGNYSSVPSSAPTKSHIGTSQASFLGQLRSPGLAGFFFATCPCKIVRTKTPSRTKTLELRDLVFRDARRKIIPHDD